MAYNKFPKPNCRLDVGCSCDADNEATGTYNSFTCSDRSDKSRLEIDPYPRVKKQSVQTLNGTKPNIELIRSFFSSKFLNVPLRRESRRSNVGSPGSSSIISDEKCVRLRRGSDMLIILLCGSCERTYSSYSSSSIFWYWSKCALLDRLSGRGDPDMTLPVVKCVKLYALLQHSKIALE